MPRAVGDQVHNEAKRFARDDYDILLIGHEGHEEVIGTAGEAPTTFSWSTDRTRSTRRRSATSKIIWLSQTTLSVDGRWRPSRGFASDSSTCRIRPAMTSATPRRIARSRSKAMAPEYELWLSSALEFLQPVRLVEVALGAGADAAHLVDCRRHRRRVA